MTTWSALWPVLVASAVTAVAWAAVAAALRLVTGRVNVIDTLWPLGFTAIAFVAAIVAAVEADPDPVRVGLVLGLVLAWSSRLAIFVGVRSAGKPDDRRYTEMLERHGGATRTALVLRVYVLQAVALYVVSLTLQVSLVEPGPVGVAAWVGVGVWVAGLSFEAVGDAQLDRFRRDPDRHGLIDSGLWRWTRHPNYAGEALVWIGLFLLGADHWPGLATVVSPAVMILLLTAGSGLRILERSMREREGWEAYAARTSSFVPLPPGLKPRLLAALDRSRGQRGSRWSKTP